MHFRMFEWMGSAHDTDAQTTEVARVDDARAATAWWCRHMDAVVVEVYTYGELSVVELSLGDGAVRVAIVGGPGAMECWLPAGSEQESSGGSAPTDPWGNELPVGRLPGPGARRASDPGLDPAGRPDRAMPAA